MISARSFNFYIQISILFVITFPGLGLAGDVLPPVTLAKRYDESIDVSQYWVSEKLDGVRAYWDGEHLISRQGNRFEAPGWFTQGFPEQALDGELWTGRNQFQSLMSIVTKQKGDGAGWKRVRYCVFDLPLHTGSFSQRLKALQQLHAQSKQPYFKVVEQFRIQTSQELMQRLDSIIRVGGEGLMLQRADARHAVGRSNNLLKLKRHQDAEARVLSHLPGKGKYKGMMGSLLVEDAEGVQFRIGTGFKDTERREPPPIGSLITYKYYGKTRKGIPRFASFMRVRDRH
jgi:DNA ligase-1